ncbi:tRNA 2-selenouridine(34) synthase MnmH [bacterium]|nr:tRNA 2-selenouridine(34) synthase MnmH [bacterium]
MDSAIHEILKVFLDGRSCIIDVRSPSEYAQGHIPGSQSLPLFDDAERHKVGLCYAESGQAAAVRLGLELAGPKLKNLVDRAEALSDGRPIGLYCWRGGMRSGSMAWLLQTAGLEVQTLVGGYKTYRRALKSLFESPLPLRVLCGPTGSDKTGILHALATQGAQVVDLEGLAHHKGSSFGAIGQPEQPSNETFQNRVFEAFRRLDPNQWMWIEDESHAIGKVRLPDGLYAGLLRAHWVWVDRPFELRLGHLVETYGSAPRELLRAGIERIRRRLGGKDCTFALDYLDRGELRECAALLLTYYDRTYREGMAKKNPELGVIWSGDSADIASIARQIIALEPTNPHRHFHE